MKPIASIKSTMLVLGMLGSVQAGILVYESFAEATPNQPLAGYFGTDTVTEIGLTGVWSANHGASPNIAQLKERDEASWNTAIAGGHLVDSDESGQEHWLEHQNVWNPTIGTRPLGSGLDLATDGTYYMSFFSRAGGTDVVLQMGLGDGTNELMWGNGYAGGNPAQGITAYFAAAGGSPAANGDGTFLNVATAWSPVFWVARLEKTNSGASDDLEVSIKAYDLGANNNIDFTDPASWSRVVSLAGVSGTFNELRLKVDGASGQWPGIDEFRIGQSWADVSGATKDHTGFRTPADLVKQQAAELTAAPASAMVGLRYRS